MQWRDPQASDAGESSVVESLPKWAQVEFARDPDDLDDAWTPAALVPLRSTFGPGSICSQQVDQQLARQPPQVQGGSRELGEVASVDLEV